MTSELYGRGPWAAIFLAPLNSMASNIGGFTFHGWGEVPFKVARGAVSCSRSRVENDLRSSMLGQCGALRVICIDEAGATGAETAGKLEGNVAKHISAQDYYIYTRAHTHIYIHIYTHIYIYPRGSGPRPQNSSPDPPWQDRGVPGSPETAPGLHPNTLHPRKTTPEGSQTPKMAPRQPQRPPRPPKRGPRGSQEASQESPKRHKSLIFMCVSIFFGFSPFRLPDAPRRPKRPPIPLQDGPRGPQEGPKTAQEGPKTAEDPPKTA